MKKILSILLTLIFVFSISMTSFADNILTDTDLTIGNIQKVVVLGNVAPGYHITDSVLVYTQSTGANTPNYPIDATFSADGTGFTGDTVTLTGSGTNKGVMANISGYAPTSSGAFSFTVSWNCGETRVNDANATMTYCGTVVATDTTSPTFTFVPANKSVEATGTTTAVDIGMATAIDASGCTVTNNAPSVFPYGETTVTWTATDANGLTNTATQVITIVDTTVPVFTELPSAKTVEATAVNTPKSDISFGTVTATDIFGATVTNNAPETFPMGSTTVTWTATDGNGLTSTATQVITIVDTTVPVFTELPSAKTVEATAVNTPKSDISFGTVAATDVFGATVTNNEPETFPMGSTTVTWTATDGNGLTSTATQVITIVDTTYPVFTFVPSNKTVKATGISTTVDIGMATATDIFGVKITNNAPAVFPLGQTEITWRATDGNGLIRIATQVITVEYDFTGFFQPIDMGGVINTVKAGSSIPVKFSLGGDMGLNIFKTTPTAIALIVNPLALVSDIPTVTAGNSGLSYDPISKQYTYVWKTDKSWAGLSKKLVVRFNDGTECTANFKFK